MGMVYCRGCAKEIHETASACPHCGAPQNISTSTPNIDKPVYIDSLDHSSYGGNEYILALKKYADFTGRSSRKEYWMFFLYSFVISFLIGFFEGLFGSGPGVLSNIYMIAIFIPSIAVGVRRMHDTNRSGWWLLVPIVNLVFLCQKSEDANSTEHRKISGLALIALVFFGLIPVIGILAAIILPAYQDYSVRAKVAEVLLISNRAKLSVEEYVEKNHSIPNKIEQTGFLEKSKYIEKININGENGIMSVELSFPPVKGKKIIFSPSVDTNKNIVWHCYSQDLKSSFLPQLCR